MSWFDVLSLAGRFWPGPARLVVIAALIFAPQTAMSIFMQGARAKGTQVMAPLEHSIDRMLKHRSASSDCHGQSRCAR